LTAAWRDSAKLFGKLKGTFATANVLYARRRLINKLVEELGLYTGGKLLTFLQLKLELKIGKPPAETGFSFAYLNERGCVPLKIVAADLGRRAPTVYSLKSTPERSVLDAVRASMSYPFVFQPVLLYNAYQVDGGLSSNLPLSVFEEERRRDGATVVAFDLEASRKDQPAPYGLKEFCGDLLSTALESGELLVRELLSGIHHVRIPIPEGIDTLDFGISVANRETLFNAGYAATARYLMRIVPQWHQARSVIEALEATHAPRRIIIPVLKAVVEVIERETKAENMRAHVMLPTGQGRRVVAYSYNMDQDPDVDLELDMDAGCTGATWAQGKVIFADLEHAKGSFKDKWKMTQAEQNKIRRDRRAMCSIPIFEKEIGERSEHWRVMGTLSFDTSSRLEDVWGGGRGDDPMARFVVDTGKLFGDIVGRLLNRKAL
jgi:NTE family protein